MNIEPIPGEPPRAAITIAKTLARIIHALQQVQDGAEAESLPLHTNLTVRVEDAQGALKAERVIHNLICAAGKNKLLAVSGGESLTAFACIAIGTGTSAPAITDTALQTEIARSAAQMPTNPGAGVYQVQYTFPAGTGTGAITEAGLLDAPYGGNLLAHQTFAAVNKGASDTLTIQWQIS